MATFEKAPSPEQQVRLITWYIPRSTSTVLSKCLGSVEDTKVFLGMFGNAMQHDAEKTEDGAVNVSEIGQRLNAFFEVTDVSGIDASQFTYQRIKEQLEEAHPEKRFIFAKDIAFAITGHPEFIPRGYRHLFLIRHPLKVFVSIKKVLMQIVKDVSPEELRIDELPPNFLPKGFGYKETFELFEHIKKEIDPEAMIVDSDDLLQDPKGILSAVLKDIGLPFDEKMLHWESGDAVNKDWVIPREVLQADTKVNFYKKALDSTCFQKPNALPDRASISPDILRVVDASMPYYEKMYSQRLSP
ncbi:branched-chain-amino-acid aminotransferase-like protein 1 [Patiria miniata]|uniref:Sulfotransferase family protein n=1 Tax=Patiria miniata TaxID=46514 RepID=A0A913ZK28_PATMI|nr:branched-chain-amino-acid aminotransferase-like protein 1 [Patiria miniata]